VQLHHSIEEKVLLLTYESLSQLVEHNLAKVGVASSSLVSRSKLFKPRFFGAFCILGDE